MNSELQQIISILPHLSKDDLTRIQHAVGSLLSLGGYAVREEVHGTPDPLLFVISEVLQSKGLEFCSVFELRRSRAYKKFQHEIAPSIDRFLDAQGNLTKLEKNQILHVGVRLLIDDLQSWHAGVSGRDILRFMHKLPMLINKAFPGYAQCGMLRMIIQKEISK